MKISKKQIKDAEDLFLRLKKNQMLRRTFRKKYEKEYKKKEKLITVGG